MIKVHAPESKGSIINAHKKEVLQIPNVVILKEFITESGGYEYHCLLCHNTEFKEFFLGGTIINYYWTPNNESKHRPSHAVHYGMPDTKAQLKLAIQKLTNRLAREGDILEATK